MHSTIETKVVWLSKTDGQGATNGRSGGTGHGHPGEATSEGSRVYTGWQPGSKMGIPVWRFFLSGG